MEKYTLFNSLTKSCYIGHIKKFHDPLHTTAATKTNCGSKMPWSVTGGVSHKSKLVYNSLIFVDNKLTLIGYIESAEQSRTAEHF